jgi:apolipoprotein D and lipocalin family protein
MKSNNNKILVAGAIVGSLAAYLLVRKKINALQVNAVKPFDIDRYLGQWYEIARIDNRFERNMERVSALYSTNPDGTIKVENRGFDLNAGKWKNIEGKAKFAGAVNEARLRVSFFPAIYSDYTVVAIDEGYKNALVVGQNLKYLWILSRNKTMPEHLYNEYIIKAKHIGFDINKIIKTLQSK